MSPRDIPLQDWSLSTNSQDWILMDGYTFDNQTADKPWSITALDSDSVRFELRDNDRHSWDVSVGHPVERAELASIFQPISNGTPLHISYGFMVEPGDTNTAWWTVLGQLHPDLGDSAGMAPPDFEIMLDGERMKLVINYGDQNNPLTKTLYLDNANIERGRLYDMKISAIFDPTGTNGRLVVQRDGVTLADYSGPLGYIQQTGVYWAEGIYRSDNATETIAAQYRNLDIQTGASVTMPDKGDFIAAPSVKIGTTAYDASRGVSTVSLSGTAAAGDMVSIYDGKTLLGTAQTSAGGTYSLQVALTRSGTHALTAVATNEAGRSGIGSSPTEILVTTSADLVSKLAALSADPSLAGIVLTDGNVLRVTSTLDLSYAKKDAAILSTIPGGYSLVLSQAITGKPYDQQDTTYTPDGKVVDIKRWASGKLVFDDAFASNGTQTLRTWSSNGTSDLSIVNTAGVTIHYERYDTNGKLLFTQDNNADGTQIIRYFNTTTGSLVHYVNVAADGSKTDTYVNLTNGSYTTQITAYNSAGAATSLTRQNAAGLIVYSRTYNADGSQTSITYSPTTGTKLSSVLTQPDGSHTDTTYGIVGKTYVTQAISYDARGRVLGQSLWDAGGKLISSIVWNTDGSKQVMTLDPANGNVLGYVLTQSDKSHVDVLFAAPNSNIIAQSSSYSSTNQLLSRQLFDSAGKLVESDAYNSDGSWTAKTYSGDTLLKISNYSSSGTLISETSYQAPPASGSATAQWTDPATGITTSKVVATDGSWTEQLTGFSGVPFDTEIDKYDANGTLRSQSRSSNGATIYAMTRAADGTQQIQTFAPNGTELSSTVIAPDGSRTDSVNSIVGKNFDRQTVVSDRNWKALDVTRWSNDNVVFSQTTADGGTKTIKSWNAARELTVTQISPTGFVTSIQRYLASGVPISSEIRSPDGSRETQVYDPLTGKPTSYTIYYADKSREEVNLSVPGKPYATQDSIYDSNGKLVSMTRRYGGATGQIALSMTTQSDGSVITSNYDTSGRETAQTIVRTDGSRDVLTPTYSAGSSVASSSIDSRYDSTGVKLWTDVTMADGSHSITALAAALTFRSNAGVNDTFRSAGGDTFVFEPGSGRDTIIGFRGGTGVGSDTLELSRSIASSFSDLNMQAVGNNVVISLGANDSVTLANTQLSQLTVNNFSFV